MTFEWNISLTIKNNLPNCSSTQRNSMPLPHSSLTLPSTSITISKPRVQSKTSLSRMEARHQEGGGGGEEDKTAAAGKGLSSSLLLSLLFGAGERESETEADTPRLRKTDVKTTDQHYNHVQKRRLPSLIHIPEAGDKSSGESWREAVQVYIYMELGRRC